MDSEAVINFGENQPRYVIGRITNGLGAETDITYSALGTGGHYTRLDATAIDAPVFPLGQSVSPLLCGIESAYDVIDDWCGQYEINTANDLYTALNQDWAEVLPSADGFVGRWGTRDIPAANNTSP